MSFSTIGLQHYHGYTAFGSHRPAARSPKKSDEATLEWKNPLQILEAHVFAVQKMYIIYITYTVFLLNPFVP